MLLSYDYIYIRIPIAEVRHLVTLSLLTEGNNSMRSRRALPTGIVYAIQGIMLSGCAQSAYDFPVATMVGQQRGYSMTGFVKSADEGAARTAILQRLRGVCPTGAEIVDLKTIRADAKIGTKILRYEALAVCRTNP